MLSEEELAALKEQLREEPAVGGDVAELTRWAHQKRAAALRLLEHLDGLESSVGGPFAAGVVSACRGRILKERDGAVALQGTAQLETCSVHLVHVRGWGATAYVDLRIKVEPPAAVEEGMERAKLADHQVE